MSTESVDQDLIEKLQSRIDELEERVDDLESHSPGGSGGFSSGAGPRDQAVLDQLDAGDVVTVNGLKQLYQIHTDIRTKSTLKNRVKSLTNRPVFDFMTPGKWRYIGGDSDE